MTQMDENFKKIMAALIFDCVSEGCTPEETQEVVNSFLEPTRTALREKANALLREEEKRKKEEEYIKQGELWD